MKTVVKTVIAAARKGCFFFAPKGLAFRKLFETMVIKLPLLKRVLVYSNGPRLAWCKPIFAQSSASIDVFANLTVIDRFTRQF
jgi:hypothetical protein